MLLFLKQKMFCHHVVYSLDVNVNTFYLKKNKKNEPVVFYLSTYVLVPLTY